MLAMLILMLVILMLILMLLNLNTGYADADADLCIRIMSLCCSECGESHLATQALTKTGMHIEEIRVNCIVV